MVDPRGFAVWAVGRVAYVLFLLVMLGLLLWTLGKGGCSWN